MNNTTATATMTKSNDASPVAAKRQLERTNAITYTPQTNAKPPRSGQRRASQTRPPPHRPPITRAGSVPRDINTVNPNTRQGKLHKSPSVQFFAQHPNPSAQPKTVRFTSVTNPPIHIQCTSSEHPEKKHKFSKVIKKYWTNLTGNLILDTDQNEKESGPEGFRSCPDLHCKRQGSKESLLAPPRSPSSLSDDGSFGSPHKLTVPDLFTTSFTRSADRKKVPVSRTLTLPTSLSFSSAPDLVMQDLEESQQAKKLNLKKSYSDCPPRQPSASGGESLLPQKPHRPLQMTWEPPRANRVHQNLYLGNVEATHNERMLCKLNIVSVIELDSEEPPERDPNPPSLRPSIPCPCQSQHSSPAILRLSVGDDSVSKFESTVPSINRFITGALDKDKGVLVYCRHGNNGLAALAVMQYLVTEVGMSLRRAYSAVMKCTSQQLPLRYTRWLESLEPLRNSIDLPKPAWTDS